MKKTHKICYLTGATLVIVLALLGSIHSLSNVHGNTYEGSTTEMTVDVIETTIESTEISPMEESVSYDETTTIESTTIEQKQNPIKKITLSSKKLTIVKGKKKSLTATVTYKNKNGIKESFHYTSSNPKVASVSTKGKIKALSVGKTKILCTSASGKVYATCKIIVIKPYNSVKFISLNEKKIRLNSGDKRYMKATVLYKTSKYSVNESLKWISSNKQIATVSKKGTIIGKKEGHCYIKIKSKYSKVSAKVKVTVGPTKYIAITFDDGPGPYTDKLLDALSKYDGKATFLLVGSSVGTYASQVKREYRLGMQIGNHTWSHANLNISSTAQIKSQINNAKKAIKKVLGVSPTIFRPPYGNYNKMVSKAVDVPMIFWSVDTLDWKYRNVGHVKNAILKNAYDGAVVLLHDIHSTSVDGFIKALPKLIKKNYELVTVEELFKIKGKKMKTGVMYYDAK